MLMPPLTPSYLSCSQLTKLFATPAGYVYLGYSVVEMSLFVCCEGTGYVLLPLI
uniref:Uncharacterized protein n=1 Tax=Arundo donax TaxID=35708 RepID=A0A0A9CVF6_ARUDO